MLINVLSDDKSASQAQRQVTKKEVIKAFSPDAGSDQSTETVNRPVPSQLHISL